MSDWRELHRTDDLREAVGLATTIASMEFDVRWDGRGPAAVDDDDSPGEPPYIIEVKAEDWADLREVLAAIADEQEEFDTIWTARRRARELLLIVILMILTLIPVVFSMITILRLAENADERSRGSTLWTSSPAAAMQIVRA